MKRIYKLILILVLLIGFSVSATSVNAHLANQVPFFKINGIFTPLYPVSPDFNTNITLPQDIGSDNYLINQELNLELDQNNVPVAPGVWDVVTFKWDLGDGTKAEGLNVNHRYQKIGSYLIRINAVYADEEPQLLQSTLVNIVPTHDYKLPQAVIKINDKSVVNDPTQPLKVLLNEPIDLDGLSSMSQSGKIIKYEWDLDSNDLPEGSTVQINYKNSFDKVYPALKITDENGFISYAVVGLERMDQNFFKATWFKITDWANSNQQIIELILILSPLVFSLPLLVLIVLKWLKRKRGKKSE